MDLFFLEASQKLTKSYTLKEGGEILKTPYPMTWEFTSHKVQVNDLVQFETAVRRHAGMGNCMIKGPLQRTLVKESRAGSTATNDSTGWICLDFDGLPETVELTSSKGKSSRVPLTVPVVLDLLGLSNISYIAQYSASYGITDQRLRCHIFMLLDKPATAPLLKQWLIQLNHDTEILTGAMTLTRTGNAISWPLDVSACQNDKLIYIAKPVLNGIPDPMGRQPRIQLIKHKHDTLTLPATINTATKNRQLTTRRVNELREAEGLPKRTPVFKVHGSVEVMLKPDSAVITEMKAERGFVYFNLNGGDSWAYYHPENNPDYIYNFKGEPSYLTKELLPDYWEEVTASGTKVTSQGLLYLAFCDRSTSSYWRGTYDTTSDTLVLNAAKNETQVRHFAKQYGMPLGDFIPEWDLVFDPHSSVRVDPKLRIVNTFNPSACMRAIPRPSKSVPPTIAKVINSALGGRQDVFEHFINWLAFILQERDQTKTAWILHGRTKTGKGVLMNNILRPLFGTTHTTVRRMEELNEPYNHYMRDALLIFVDEVQTKALVNERGVMARMKNFITEPVVSIRLMYANAHEARNYSNWMFFSNMPDPVAIEKNDRRFNVGTYQSVPLDITADEIEVLIPKELQAFHDYLHQYKYDKDAARRVLETEDRDLMISVSESSVDTVASALLEGSMEFFIDHLPTDNSHESARDKRYDRVEDYRACLRKLLARMDPRNGRTSIGREELRTLFDYCVGGMPESPNKFTSLLKHHRIHIEKVRIGDKTLRGIKVTFKDFAQAKKFSTAVDPVPTPIRRVK